MKNKNLDNLFKDGLNQKSFDYDKNAWEEFKKLQRENQDNKPIGILHFKRWIGFLALLLISVSVFYTLNGTNKIIEKQSVSHLNNSIESQSKLKFTTKSESHNTNNLSEAKLGDDKSDINIAPPTKNKKIDNTRSTAQQKLLARKTFLSNNSNDNEEEIKSYLQLSGSPLNTLHQKQAKADSAPNSVIFQEEQKSSLPTLNILKSQLTQETQTQKVKFLVPNDLVTIDRKTTSSLVLNGSTGIGSLAVKFYELGIGIVTPISEKLFLSLVPTIHFINARELPKHRGFDTKYSLVEETFFGQYIEVDQLHLIKIPISIGLNLNRRHKISLGMAYQYLAATRGTITKTIDNQEQRYKAWIIETGLNRNLVSTHLEYGYKINSSNEIFFQGEIFLNDLYNQNVDFQVSQRFKTIKLGMKHYFRAN